MLQILKPASRWCPAIVFAGLLFYYSSTPGLPDFFRPFEFKDKLLHATAYGLFAVLLFRAFWSDQRPLGRTAVLVVIVATVFGIASELHQSTIPLRHADVFDVVADFVGAVAVSVAVITRLQYSRRSLRKIGKSECSND